MTDHQAELHELIPDKDSELYLDYIKSVELVSISLLRGPEAPQQQYRSLPLTMVYVPGMADGRLG